MESLALWWLVGGAVVTGFNIIGELFVAFAPDPEPRSDDEIWAMVDRVEARLAAQKDE